MIDERITEDMIYDWERVKRVLMPVLRKYTQEELNDFIGAVKSFPNVTDDDIKNWDTAYIMLKSIRQQPANVINNTTVYEGGSKGKKSFTRVLTFSGGSVTDSEDSFYEDVDISGTFSFSYNNTTKRLTITSSASEFVVGRTIIELPYNYVKPYTSESTSEIVIEFYDGYEPSGETIINVRIM